MKGRSHRLQSSDPPDDWVNGSWTVDCVCGVNFDDGEEMVNCDECSVWVHTRCSRYVKGDDNFVCDKCKSKNNRNDSEETEVAQLLVELPTKTVRIESSYASNGPPRRPFRLWTDIPMEERVHVQGIPGGDPALFGGLPSVFTPELWKCTGYVPKKFNFRYKEFPCWEDKEGDAKLDEDNENPVDKGAGVLFSLSKENVFATPMAALVGLRGGDEEIARDRKVSLKETKKWESQGLDVRRSQNGLKESSLLRPVVLHSGKRKKEDSGTSKDRSGKKKARAAEKEVDANKRGAHSSRTVFTPTSDAKQLEFYEDRAPKFPKGEIHSTKNRSLKETVVKEPKPDQCFVPNGNVGNNSSEALSSDMSKQDLSIGTGLKEDKNGHKLPAVLESSPKTDDAAGSSAGHDNAGKPSIKEEGDSTAVGKLDASFEGSDKNFGQPVVEDVSGIAAEVKDKQVQDFNGDMSLTSEQPGVKKEDLDDHCGSPSHIQSSPQGDAKDRGTSKEHMLETSKVNDATVSSSQSSDHKPEDLDRSFETVSDSHINKADHLSGDSCQLKSELEGKDDLMAMQKSPSEQKHGSGIPEEHSKPGGTMLNSQGLPSQRKMVACSGKSSSSSAAILIPKSSTSDNVKSTDTPNTNHIAKPQTTPNNNINMRRDRIRDEDKDELPRKTMKERPKSFTNSVPKPSHSSRSSHDSLSKKATPESKDNVLSASTKTSSTVTTTALTSASGEPTVSLHQKAMHTNSRSSASGLPQKGEKGNLPPSQSSSKINQNHVPSVCPPVSSSSPATLSDEELALLLHQELNSSPRVPRVPRVRHAGSVPQLASPTATSMLIKRTSSSGGKDNSLVPRRKYRDAPRDGFRSSREIADEAKRVDRVSSSHDLKRQDTDYMAEASTKREDNGSSAAESVKRNVPSASATANGGPSSSTEVNERNFPSIQSSPKTTSDDDTGTVGGPVHRTLPGLINEIMSKGRRMTYEELCNAVLPHWHNLRKHNGERYAYASHSQAVLDCLRNRHEWARLVDRGPKTNSSRKRRKIDTEDSEDNEYGKGKTANQVESKSLESQKEEVPKGKRKARKRRLTIRGRQVKDIRKRRKADMLSDEDFGTSSDSSEESMSSEDEIQGGGPRPEGSEASASSDETRL